MSQPGDWLMIHKEAIMEKKMFCINEYSSRSGASFQSYRNRWRAQVGTILGGALLLLSAPAPVQADSELHFHNIATVEGIGLDYSRVPSASAAIWEQFRQQGTFTFVDGFDSPLKWRGSPGVAVLDYDRDGDLDLYVTNGPGAANSLFANQLQEAGEMTFVDVGLSAGVGAVDQDSSGVCFGDTDNDGDPDLLVLSNFGYNRFFENNGADAAGIVTFTDLSSTSAISSDIRSSMSCSFGDVNGDGLLDVVVANSYLDMGNSFGIALDPFAFNQHNQLFLNTGGNNFAEASSSSGIQELRGFPSGFEGAPSLTWAIAMVDYDLDGDVDIVQADDQASIPMAKYGGLDRGFIHILRNDGSGHFTDVTVESNMDRAGAWMGLSFGDVNGDGYLDMFSTNFGDWGMTPFSPLDPFFADFAIYELGDFTTRWFLGANDGVLSDPGVGNLVATPFGWGTSMADYDNDGDTDIIYHGGMSSGPIVQCDNRGVILENDGTGLFSYDAEALDESTDHQRRLVHGMAVGDLNRDGFTDIVSVSNSDIQNEIPLRAYGVSWGSPFDELGAFQATFLPTDIPGVWRLSDFEDNVNGSVSVEISSADNGNGWIRVKLLGTTGMTTAGTVNRDGIGAVVSLMTSGGASTMRPVMGGASYASQDSLELVFGLGSSRKGQVEVLWPGGVRNRLDNVHRGERILFPEIPCSYDGEWQDFVEYKNCVLAALTEIADGGALSRQQKGRFFASAVRAYHDSR